MRQPTLFLSRGKPWKFNRETVPCNLKFTTPPIQNGTISQAQVCCTEREITQDTKIKSKTKVTAGDHFSSWSPFRSHSPAQHRWRGLALDSSLTNVPRPTWQAGSQEAEVSPTGLCQRCTYSGTADILEKRIKYLYITEATLACLW